MRPKFYPSLVNDRFGDPVVFVDFLLERRAILFDLGDIHALPARSVLRVSDVFVSHTHIDHFAGFDRLLRLSVGRDRLIRLYGPPRFIANVEAKLAAYTWNLAETFVDDLVFEVVELEDAENCRAARFRLTRRFAREDLGSRKLRDGVLLDEPSLSVRAAMLEHRTPCLAFALQEPEHINVWKNRLDERGFVTGPWLAELKAAIFERKPDDTPMRVGLASGGERALPLGELRRDLVTITAGQKIAYVADAAFSPPNRRAIVDLARDADTLFIEAAFAAQDAEIAAGRAHLTTAQAGELARLANAVRVIPFHFSPRYAGEEACMLREVEDAFAGKPELA
ncbi:ribonuclease Z [Oricola nitratireducens]|jgi:ribonuclease Z|uniref:ribonuclease Z n=1 Tax=Oricola nitratireducens TaxID=2775868 RepID=UPI0018684335|nr:MBL fold metallo-hydrolase [Oricola nitratireducens]